LFWTEARTNEVLPLDDRVFERLSLTNDARQAQQRPSLTAGRIHFVYYPGAVGINEASVPNLKNRSYAITARVRGQGIWQHTPAAARGGCPARKVRTSADAAQHRGRRR
jgi:arylsulfatase